MLELWQKPFSIFTVNSYIDFEHNDLALGVIIYREDRFLIQMLQIKLQSENFLF